MRIEPELVEEVLDEVSTGRIEQSIAGVGAVEGTARAGRIETPYLQLVLQRLWEVERGQGSEVMRLETFRSLGGAERIVQDHLERAMRALSPAERAAAASVFGHLVTPSGSKIAHGTSDLATYAELEEGEMRPVLDSLARQRILRPLGENGHAGGRYEIFHDVLAGAVLAWSTRHEADVALEEERKRRRRLGWLAAVALVGLALMAALAAYAFSQRSAAQQRSEELGQTNTKLTRLESRAKKTARLAVRAARRATKQESLARAAAASALEAKAEARAAQAVAVEAAGRAAAGEKDAKQAQAEAVNSANTARRAELHAKSEARRAKIAKKQAQDAREAAYTAERARRFQFYLATSVGLVGREPEKSATAAVQAAGLAENKNDRLAAENTLRAALVAMRVQHVLPGLGSGGTGMSSLSTNEDRGAEVARFSADGRRAVVGVGGNSRKIRVFRVRDGKLLRTLTAGAPVRDVAPSRTGQFVAAGADDGRVWVWDVDSGDLRQFDHGAPVSGVVWSPTADVLASVGGKTALLWDISTQAMRRLRPQTHNLHTAVFSPDGRRVATYGEGHIVRVFDVDTAILIAPFAYPTGPLPVTGAEFGPNGDVIATSRGNSARLWTIDSGEYMSFGGHTSAVLDVAVSESGEYVATGSLDTLARVFTVATGVLRDTFYGHTGLGINDIDFSPEKGSTAIVTAGADHTARFFANGQLSVPLLGHRRAVLGASFSPDGRSVLTSSKDGTARLFDPYAGEPLPEVLADYGPSGRVNSVAVDPSGSFIAVGGENGAVRVLSTKGRLLRTPVEAGGSAVVTVAWARGQQLLVATRDGRVRIWENADASTPREFRHGGRIKAAAISRDGTLAATAGENSVARIWHVASGALTPPLRHDGPVTAVAFSSTGEAVATASGQTAYTWSTTTGKLRRTFATESERSVTAVTFGNHDRLLATTSGNFPKTWDTRTGHLRKTFVGHGSDVQGVAFSPDGRWFATVASRKAAIWQVGESNLDQNFLLFVALPLQQQSPLTSVAFSPNHTVVMGNRNGQVLAYSCRFCGRLPQLVRMAKDKLARLDEESRR